MASLNNESQTEALNPESSGNRRPVGRLIFDSVCITLLVSAVGYLAWFGISATRTVSRSLAGPETVVRLQIVNATTDPTLANAVAGLLAKSADSKVSFAVVDTEQFSARKVAKSFLVARGENSNTAKMVAQRLGMTVDRISALPLEHNIKNVSITLVLGDDYRSLTLSPGTGKETDRKT